MEKNIITYYNPRTSNVEALPESDYYTEVLHELLEKHDLTHTEKQSINYAISAIKTLVDAGIIW